MDSKELNRRFDHHPPHGAKIKLHEEVRRRYRLLAELINEVPASREQACAFTALEESMFWTNAAIARNELPVPGAELVGSPTEKFLEPIFKKSEADHKAR